MVYVYVMIRTQVYLPQYQINHLKVLASRNSTTMSDELRKKLDFTIKTKKAKKSLSEILANGNTDWFDTKAEIEIVKSRKQIEQRLKKWAF